MKTQKQEVGELGETLACKYLEQHGFEILDRNYRKKWGELDIVASKPFDDAQGRRQILHFVEVKSVSHVSCETGYQPEENVHPWKRKRLGRAILTYLLEKKIPDEMEWQFSVIAVFLDFNTRKANIRMTENVML